MRPLLSLVLVAGCGQASPTSPDPEVAALQAQIEALNGTVAALAQTVSELQAEDTVAPADLGPLLALVPYLEVDSETDDVRIVGANLHVENGAGDTAALNGRGNLIVGYDRWFEGAERSGSHNLVLGDENMYGGYGGIVASYAAGIFGRNAVVLGGEMAWVEADGGAVLGGNGGQASGVDGAVVGGLAAEALGEGAVVIGGTAGAAAGRRSTVVGGSWNGADAMEAVVVGGSGLHTSTEGSTVVGP